MKLINCNFSFSRINIMVKIKKEPKPLKSNSISRQIQNVDRKKKKKKRIKLKDPLKPIWWNKVQGIFTKFIQEGETLPRGKLNNGSPPGTTQKHPSFPAPTNHNYKIYAILIKKSCSLCPPPTGTLFTSLIFGSQKLYTERRLLANLPLRSSSSFMKIFRENCSPWDVVIVKGA